MSKLLWLCVLTIFLNGSSFGADTDATLRGVVTDVDGGRYSECGGEGGALGYKRSR